MRGFTGLTVVLALAGCKKDDSKVGPPDPGDRQHPFLIAQPDDRAIVLSRLDREPYATVYAQVLAHADDEFREPDPVAWDHSDHGHNAEVSAANAFLAWLHEDQARADKAREGFTYLEDDYETHTVFDINIRMPHSLLGYTDAWDFLSATPWFPESEAAEAERKITEINRKFYEQYVEDPFYRGVWLGPSQNNHPIRTASAIAYVGMAFPEHPDAEKWLDWSLGELTYLWGPNGQYVQPDGGVSEGPFYYGFAWGVSTAAFIAADHALDPEAVYHWNCVNRQDVDPWTGHGCVDGAEFTFDNPLHGDLYASTVEWSMSLRLPDGNRPPLADAYFNPFNGAALLTGFGGGGHFRWDWENNVERPYEMGHGADLVLHHLVHVDDTVSPVEPPWLTRFMPDAGNAVFRSDWSPDARWLLLVAEHGSARKTLHDHADGTSFSMAAYGEYLLVDPGYYKPNSLDNAVTSQPDAHNVLLIDGKGAPEKGLLTNFGDADAFLENTLEGAAFDYAEAHQTYQGTDIERSVIMVDDRYFVVGDRLHDDSGAQRDYQWRLNGYAGFGSGGTFALRSDGASWERELAGVDVYLGSTQPGLAFEEPEYVEGQRPHVQEFSLEREVTDHGVVDGRLTASRSNFLAILAPYRVGDAPGSQDGPLTVAQVDLGNAATGWLVETAAGTDLVAIREYGGSVDWTLPGGELVSTDAELVVVRLDGSQGLVSRGTRVSVDGVSVISGASGAVATSE